MFSLLFLLFRFMMLQAVPSLVPLTHLQLGQVNLHLGVVAMETQLTRIAMPIFEVNTAAVDFSNSCPLSLACTNLPHELVLREGIKVVHHNLYGGLCCCSRSLRRLRDH